MRYYLLMILFLFFVSAQRFQRFYAVFIRLCSVILYDDFQLFRAR